MTVLLALATFAAIFALALWFRWHEDLRAGRDPWIGEVDDQVVFRDRLGRAVRNVQEGRR